jgi:carboxymethylenebutenolidase
LSGAISGSIDRDNPADDVTMNGYNFTERVRKVLALAREESARLHHEYVGTEHILLGLLSEGGGVAATVMQNLGVDAEVLRKQIEVIVKTGRASALVGPDLPYTSRAKKVLELAMNEARELSHSYVGTEHLLLGLLREEKGIAAQVLVAAGLTTERARMEIRRILGSPGEVEGTRASLFGRMKEMAGMAMARAHSGPLAMHVAPASRGAPPRALRAGHFISLDVDDGSTMQSFVARPVDAGRKPGLILFQEAYGVNDHVRDVAMRFAALGFVVIAPELYHRTGTHVEGPYDDFAALGEHFSAITTDGLAADARAAHAWLTDDPEADTPRIAAIGYCMGGRAAFLANAELPLAASVSYYGGGIATQLLDRVDTLHGPQLLCWGGTDTHIPPEQTRAIDDALRAAGKPYTTVTFGEAGHAFFCDQRPAYQPDAAAEAWALTIAFLARTTGIAAPRT